METNTDLVERITDSANNRITLVRPTADSPIKSVSLRLNNQKDPSKDALLVSFAYIVPDLSDELALFRLINSLHRKVKRLDVTGQMEMNGRSFKTALDSTHEAVDVTWKVELTPYGDLIVSEPSGEYTSTIRDDDIREEPMTEDRLKMVLTSGLYQMRSYAEDHFNDERGGVADDLSSAFYQVEQLIDDITEDHLRQDDEFEPNLYLSMNYAPDDLINELEKLRLIHRIQNSIEQLDVTQIISGFNLSFDTQTSGGCKMDVAWNVMMTLDGDLIVSEPSGKYNAKIEDDLLRNAPVTVEQVQDVLASALDAIRDYSDERLTHEDSDDGYHRTLMKLATLFVLFSA